METQLRFADEMDQKADVLCVAFTPLWLFSARGAFAASMHAPLLPFYLFFFFFPPPQFHGVFQQNQAFGPD